MLPTASRERGGRETALPALVRDLADIVDAETAVCDHIEHVVQRQALRRRVEVERERSKEQL